MTGASCRSSGKKSSGRLARISNARASPFPFSRRTISSPRRKISTSLLLSRNSFGKRTARPEHPRCRHADISLGSAASHLAQEALERADLFLLPRKIVRDLLVEMRRAGVELVRGGVLADEVRDLVHLRHPAIGLGWHHRAAAVEPGEHLRLAAFELG